MPSASTGWPFCQASARQDSDSTLDRGHLLQVLIFPVLSDNRGRIVAMNVGSRKLARTMRGRFLERRPHLGARPWVAVAAAEPANPPDRLSCRVDYVTLYAVSRILARGERRTLLLEIAKRTKRRVTMSIVETSHPQTRSEISTSSRGRGTRRAMLGSVALFVLAWLGLPVYAYFYTGLNGAAVSIWAVTLVETMVGLALFVFGYRRIPN